MTRPPPHPITCALVVALASFAWTVSWEPLDLVGPTTALVATLVGAIAGLTYGALSRYAGFRRRRWARWGFWLALLGASFFLLPTPHQVNTEQSLVARLLQYVSLWSGPRVLANVIAMYALYPGWTITAAFGLAVTGMLVARWAPVGRRRSVAYGTIALGLAASVVAFYGFKLGPGPGTCAALDPGAGVRRIAGNELWSSEPGLEHARAYDAHPVGDGSRIVVSLKVPPSEFGAFALVDRDRGTLLDLVSVTEGIDHSVTPPLFPERIAVRDDEIFAIQQGRDSWLARAIVTDDGLEVLPAVSIPGEANSVLLDPASDRIWLFFSGASAGGIAELRGDPPRIVRHRSTLDVRYALQYSDLAPDGRSLVVTTTGGPALIRLDTEKLLVTDDVGSIPSFGVRHDPTDERIYVVSFLRRRLVAYDADDLELLRSVPIPTAGIADLDLDSEARRLVVGGYTGRLVIYDLPELEEQRRVELGWMLRNITVDPVRHEVLASSGCGVYAIDLLEGAG